MLLAERAGRVLVIGCSEGTVPQIAAQAGAERVDHVDIDRECVRLCAEHLPYGFGIEEVREAERGDGPICLHYADGADFVRDSLRKGSRYDVIVLDLPEEHEDDSGASHNALYTREFLALCRDLLVPGGVVSTHVSRSYLSLPAQDSIDTLRHPWRRFGDVFGTRSTSARTNSPGPRSCSVPRRRCPIPWTG